MSDHHGDDLDADTRAAAGAVAEDLDRLLERLPAAPSEGSYSATTPSPQQLRAAAAVLEREEAIGGGQRAAAAAVAGWLQQLAHEAELRAVTEDIRREQDAAVEPE